LTHWANKYIAYLANEGIVAGVGAGKFNPDGELTGYAFAKMLLCVLGYDAELENMLGTSWQIATSNLMQKTKVGKGTSYKGVAVLTREEAAQFAFEALKATMVEYATKGTEIVINGSATVKTGAAAATAVKKDGNTVELYEAKFTKLALATGKADDAGHKAHTWYLGAKNAKNEIGTYLDAVDETVVVADIYLDLDDVMSDDEDYFGYAEEGDAGDTELPNSCKVFFNGYETTYATGYDYDTPSGSVVEVYETANGTVDRIVVTIYEPAKIKKIDTNVTAADKKDGVESYITLKAVGTFGLTGPVTIKNTDFAGFNYKVDDTVLVAFDATENGAYGVVLASEAADTVTGKLTQVKYTSNGVYTVKVGGETYVIASNPAYNDIKDLGTEGTLVLDKAGNVVAAEKFEKQSSNYALVYNIKKTTKNDGFNSSEAYTVYVVLADGTKATYTAASADESFYDDFRYSNDDGFVRNDGGSHHEDFANFVTAYSINSDGEFAFATAKDSFVNDGMRTTAQIDKDHAKIGYNAVYATNDTEFLFVDASNAKVKKVTGYKNVDIEGSTSLYVVYDSDNEAKYIFVWGTNGVLEGDYAVLLDTPEYLSEEDADGKEVEYFTLAAFVNGKEDTLKFYDDFNFSSYNIGDVVELTVDNAGYVTGMAKQTNQNWAVQYKGDEYVEIHNDTYAKADYDIYAVIIDDTNYKEGTQILVTADLDRIATSASYEAELNQTVVVCGTSEVYIIKTIGGLF
ncbi:MAG: S-layer homology domain-containing protein, partial [Bacillota bacterium]|nr:S-layer homology domain-containing protein [Bacillota bacterium]